MRFHKLSELTAPVAIRNILVVFSLIFLGGCVAVKNPPIGKPFVYENIINVNGENLSKEKQTIFKEKLLGFLDDSLKVPVRSVLGFPQRINPPVFDSNAIYNSIRFMNGYLNSEGYYNASLDTFTVKFDTSSRKKKFFSVGKIPTIETKISFYLNLGKSLRIDTISYSLTNPEMKRLADSASATAQLKKNSPYTKQAVAIELDRLATIYRSYGFFKMSRGALIAEIDTTDESLVSFELDPIQQQLMALKRKQDPTVKIKIYQRPGVNESVFLRYDIDSVFIYPEARINDNPDSLIVAKDYTLHDIGTKVVIKDKYNHFQEKMLRRSNFLLPGSIYNEKNYFRTINSYSQMGPWQQIDVRTSARVDSTSGVTFHLFLYPAKKQSFQLDLEGSQNNNISTSNVLSGRFLAVGLGATHRSRNVWKRGTQSTTTGRAGFEINNNASSGDNGIFQTFIFTANQSFSIPRLLFPLKFVDTRKLDFRRTAINFGGTYTDRFDFFKQISANINLQWEWRKDRNSFSFSFPTFETIDTVSTDSLYKEILLNPSLAYSFTPGNSLSMRGSWEHLIKYTNSNKHSGFFRTAAEITMPGNYQLFGKDFFKFFRIEGQFVHHIKYNKHSIDFRFFGGVGWDISGKEGGTLPYFRQYVAGGSNSMRAWSVRQLGLGNSLASDTASFTDRLGDIILEWSVEYRMRLLRFFGYDLHGAVFADIGNVWNHTPASDGLGDFQLKNLYRDLAVALGYGIRWDLSFLVIRFDAGFKMKDPVREGAGWIKKLEWNSTNRLGTNSKSNVALQFGIGYPF